MKWIKFTERSPKVMMPVQTVPFAIEGWNVPEEEEVIVRSSEFEGHRRAKWHPLWGGFIFSDCIHPQQNCLFSAMQAEWLED